MYGLMGGADAIPGILGVVLRKRVQLLGSTLRARSLEYKISLTEHVPGPFHVTPLSHIVHTPMPRAMATSSTNVCR